MHIGRNNTINKQLTFRNNLHCGTESDIECFEYKLILKLPVKEKSLYSRSPAFSLPIMTG